MTHFSALLKPVLSIPAKKQISKPNYQIPAVDFDENTTEDFTSAIFWGAGFCSFLCQKINIQKKKIMSLSINSPMNLIHFDFFFIL